MPRRLLLALPLWLATAACRQIGELPDSAAPTATAEASKREDVKRPAWLASETAVFEHVRKVLEDAGFPQVRTVVLKVTEETALPAYKGEERAVYVPPFTAGEDRMAAHMTRLSASYFSGMLAYVESFQSRDAAYRAYLGLMTIAVAHELSHHVQRSRGAAKDVAPGDIYDIEAEAIELEQAFLAHEIETGAVPASWRDDYRRSVLAFRDAVPARAMDALPADDKELRRVFGRAYAAYAEGKAAAESGVNAELDAATIVYAGYTDRRLTLLQKGGRTLKQLAAAK